MTTMGIVSTGTWFPDTHVTAADIAEQSGIPEPVVREKLGIERKYVADPQVHPNQMAVNAARKAIDRAGIDPMDIDVVLCTTEEWREYLLWTTAAVMPSPTSSTSATSTPPSCSTSARAPER